RLFQDFAHLASHVARVFVFVAPEDLAGPKQDFGALGRRRQSPAVERIARGGHGLVHVVDSRYRKSSDEIAAIGRVSIFTPFTTAAGYPAAADVIVVGV